SHLSALNDGLTLSSSGGGLFRFNSVKVRSVHRGQAAVANLLKPQESIHLGLLKPRVSRDVIHLRAAHQFGLSLFWSQYPLLDELLKLDFHIRNLRWNKVREVVLCFRRTP